MRRLKCALLTILVCAASAPAAVSQQLTGDQLAKFAEFARVVCQSVKEARGEKSEAQLQADVEARAPGLLGKVFDVGGGAKGTTSREKFEGLSQEATAHLLDGDRNCRERLVQKLLSAASNPQPSPTPRPPSNPPPQSAPQPQSTRSESTPQPHPNPFPFLHSPFRTNPDGTTSCIDADGHEIVCELRKRSPK
jgi:hypothetical protein